MIRSILRITLKHRSYPTNSSKLREKEAPTVKIIEFPWDPPQIGGGFNLLAAKISCLTHQQK